MPNSYMLEDFEIKDTKAFLRAFYIGTVIWLGYISYYAIQGH